MAEKMLQFVRLQQRPPEKRDAGERRADWGEVYQAFAQEAAGNTDEARATFERLGNLDDNAYEQVASYHLARLMLSRGERDEARTALRELVDALQDTFHVFLLPLC